MPNGPRASDVEPTRGPMATRLNDASTEKLVSALESPNAWTREAAQRLLIQQQDESAISLLRNVVANSDSPKARLHALWTNEVLNGNDEGTILVALMDQHPAVRENAVRVGERHINSHPRVAKAIVALAHDENPRVRYQVAFTLGELTDRKSAISALATIAAQDADDAHIRTAVLSSVPTDADRLLVALSKNQVFKSDKGAALLHQLVGVIAARGDKAEVDRTIAFVASDRVPTDSKATIASSLAEGLSRGGQSFREVIDRQGDVVRTRIERLLDEARSIAGDPQQETERRRQAIQLLRHCPWERVGSLLSSLLKAQEPADIQLASIRSISAFDNDEVAAHLIAGWRGLSPTVRGEAAEVLLARDERATALLEAIRDGTIPAANLDPARQQVLLQHRDAEVRALAADVFGKIARPARAKVIENYRSALELSGDAKRGAVVFKARCATCHAKSNDGKLVGPDLATVQNRSPDQLLLQILDPNREVKPQYLNYQAITEDGRIKSGMIVAESESSITLRRAERAEDVIARKSIESLTSSGLSLMPEGLEQNINPQQMADLISHLQSIKD